MSLLAGILISVRTLVSNPALLVSLLTPSLLHNNANCALLAAQDAQALVISLPATIFVKHQKILVAWNAINKLAGAFKETVVPACNRALLESTTIKPLELTFAHFALWAVLFALIVVWTSTLVPSAMSQTDFSGIWLETCACLPVLKEKHLAPIKMAISNAEPAVPLVVFNVLALD